MASSGHSDIVSNWSCVKREEQCSYSNCASMPQRAVSDPRTRRPTPESDSVHSGLELLICKTRLHCKLVSPARVRFESSPFKSVVFTFIPSNPLSILQQALSFSLYSLNHSVLSLYIYSSPFLLFFLIPNFPKLDLTRFFLTLMTIGSGGSGVVGNSLFIPFLHFPSGFDLMLRIDDGFLRWSLELLGFSPLCRIQSSEFWNSFSFIFEKLDFLLS